MTPILYEKDEIDFTSQGLGALVEIYDADVAEQRNGLLQLTASYPVTGVRYDDISVGRIILAKPNQRDEPHAFRIVNTELDVMGYSLMIEADSITYDLNHNIVKHVSVNGQSGQAMMTALQMAVVNPSIFTFYSDITHVSSTSLDYVNPMEAVMGVKGSFLQIWGGELKRENRRVAMFNRRGRDNVATFRLGKNISGLKYKVGISSLVTRILPIKSVQENDTTTYLEGTPVSSQYINSYEQIYTIKVDFTDDKIKTVDDLNKASANWFVDSANTARDKPSVTIDIDVLSLQDSADYQDKFKDLESVALTDTVTVYVPEYGINVTAIVNEIHFDPIQERVTKLTVGTARMSFADSSRVQLSDLQDKVISVQEQANQTAISANGKNTNYYGSIEPSHPQAGDLWYWKNGDLSGIKQFINGEWVDLVDTNTQQQIIDSVDQALTEANAYSNQLVADNVAQVNAVLDDVQAKQADLSAQQAELDTKAQGYADKALADAKADTLATATQTAKDASDALATAKTDLTTSLNKEVTDRANAVTALDTKAKGYADTAKNDAISASTTALNTAKTDLTTSITKEVTDRQKAITDLDAKSTTAINQAKTDAQSALDALQVGGRNWLLDSKTTHSATGNNTVNQVNASHSYTLASNMSSGDMFTKFSVGSPFTLSFDWVVTGTTITGGFFPQWGGTPWGFNAPTVALSGTNTSGHYVYVGKIGSTWSGTSARTIQFRLDNVQGVLTLTNAKLEIGNKATDYTQAPEDIVLDYTTKDNVISQSLTQYQATNDGKVTKAQSDATQALGLVATKVSQTDYNTKTGDLDSKYTAVKQTADQATTDIVAIKSTNTSQDTKINTLTSDVSGTKQSISDIQTEQGAQSTKINTIQTDVTGTKQDISDIQDANGVQDGKIASISTTVDGLSSSFSTYKSTNDGKVAKAQADITANASAIATKVSQTAYDTKTGQLQTDLNTTTTTANQAKTDIVAIKSDNTKQDARMTTIESDANGTKTTVSNLQTDLGKANGSITTLQQRADGFDATVTKVNNLQVGGRNLLVATNTNTKSTLTPGNGAYTTQYVPFDGGYKYQFTYTAPSTNWAVYQFWGWVKEKYEPDTDYVLSFMANFSVPVTPSVLFANGASGNNFVQQKTTPTVPSGSDQRVVIQLHTNATIPTASDQSLYMGNFQRGGAGTFTIWDLKIEKGNLASSYTPAPEDVDSATAKAQLTADQATTSLNTYKSDADGRISKAQADIIVNANAITQKVSQSDYNAKTGDLTTKVNTAQSTADGANSTIGAYKTSNDARVASAESKITANANAITQKVSQTDYNTKTGQIDGQISSIKQTATSISQSVADVTTQVNNLQQVNLINNSDFRPDLSGWSIQSPSSGTVTTGDYDYAGNVMVLNNTAGGMLRVNSVPITLTGTTTVSYTFNYYIFGLPAGGTVYSQLTYLDSAMKEISGSYPGSVNLATTPVGSWQKRTVSNLGITPPTGATYIVFSFDVRGTGTKAGINRPILVKGSTLGDYVPGQYVNNDKISTVSQTVDSISSIVSDPTTGLTKRVQTAESSISTVQSNVGDLQSKQTQTANGLTTEISNRVTGDTNTLTQAKDFTTSSISNSESGMRSQITQTSDAIIAKIEATNLVTNSEFDPDNVGWYKLPVDGSTIDVSGKVTTPIKSYYADWDAVNGSRGMEFGATTGTWITSEPVRASSTGTYSISVLAGRPTATTTAVTMDFRLGLWDKDKKYITSVGSTNPMNGTTYLPLRYYKSENITVPSNTAFVSFVLGHSGSGTPDAIYHPMINHGATISPYTPTYGTNSSSTILSLLKDNWSIGIADNAGAITNGIVGNSTNMSLISNNVVINAPSTQIKGTAWINSAMIGNGQIGTAQIGDASITSAKISNLDVNKLTGNVSSFIQSNWNGKYASTTIDNTGMSINGGNTTTKFDTSGAHYSNGSGISATYSFGKWSDQSGNATSSTGLYLGATGSENSFINILGTNGAAALVLAGSAMDYGSNLNIMQGTLNSFVNMNVRQQLHFKGNRYNSPSYIEINESNRTFNFWTGGGSQGGGNYFYFNQNVISAGTFSSTSVLSKKNVKSVYDEDALGEIAKTQLVNFEYKNRIGQNHVSPIIDDVNSEKEYYIPKTILGQDNEYVDMYSMISMAWKAIQQLNEKIGEK